MAMRCSSTLTIACVSSSSNCILARLPDGDPSPVSSPSNTVFNCGATDICRPELVLVISGGAVGLLLIPGMLNVLCSQTMFQLGSCSPSPACLCYICGNSCNEGQFWTPCLATDMQAPHGCRCAVLCSELSTVARCMPHVRERAHCLESVHMLTVSTTRFTFGLGGAVQATQGVMTVATVCASISFTAALPLSRWNVSSSSCNVHWLAAGSSAMTRFARAGC